MALDFLKKLFSKGESQAASPADAVEDHLVVKLVKETLADAVHRGADEIHFELGSEEPLAARSRETQIANVLRSFRRRSPAGKNIWSAIAREADRVTNRAQAAARSRQERLLFVRLRVVHSTPAQPERPALHP